MSRLATTALVMVDTLTTAALIVSEVVVVVGATVTARLEGWAAR